MKSTFLFSIIILAMATFVVGQPGFRAVKIIETAANGHQLQQIAPATHAADNAIQIVVNPQRTFQTITGFGGSFTEATAHLLSKLSAAKRAEILQAYFGDDGARYSLTRTHINSCDFSLKQYAYANVPGDTMLTHFSIAEDKRLLIPMIKAAQAVSTDGFRIIASPWTAPPWMKDNNDWRGGKLLPQYSNTWALYFSKYLQAYQQEGIDIWGVTVENEPLGNNNNWESMHFTAEEMTAFVKDFLGPQLAADGYGKVKILGYDQNRGEELKHWASAMYKDEASSTYFSGMAVHWYASTYDYFPESLQFTHQLAPTKHIINTEACVDAEVPHWKDDNWYWSKEATDWGWDWATAEQKYLHPKYVPVFRYAADIIGCLNNYVDGWIDWNMVLDKQGGPNWFKNWCTAPVIVDVESDEVYFTPLYYTMAHFSKYIRPGATRIAVTCADKEMMVTAAHNTDGSIVLIVFNPTQQSKNIELNLQQQQVPFQISAQAIQTILL